MTFEEWMAEVNRIVDRAVGNNIESMVGDMMFCDAFEAGVTPQEFVADDVFRAVEAEWGPDYARLLFEGLEDLE